jgi:FMN reductase
MSDYTPVIVGLGGTTRKGSSAEKALAYALKGAAAVGAKTIMFDGPSLVLPLYAPENPERTDGALRLIEALRQADGVIISSPGYHGSISGLLKNALDYVEDMSKDKNVYFEGRSIGLIACAYGWQATGSTLATLRSIAHALRGWPTPLGVAINSLGNAFDAEGVPSEAGIRSQLELLGRQVTDFARHRTHYLRSTNEPVAIV